MAVILLDILAPIFIMTAIGALARWQFKFDMNTLSKINLYILVPAFIFHRVGNSTLDWTAMGGVVAVTLVQSLLLGAIVGIAGRLARVDRKTLAAVAMASMFYNSGNYGLPLAELAYGEEQSAVQAFVLMTQNLLTFTLGLLLASAGTAHSLSASLWKILRLPMLPALALAVLVRGLIGPEGDLGAIDRLPKLIRVPVEYLSVALVPVALLTLGAQLSVRPRWPRWKPISVILFVRLILGPIVMAGILLVTSLFWTEVWPWPAELLILTAGVPTAVNTLLITMELDGDSELAADAVFWTTLASCVSITALLAVVKALL